MNKNPENNQLRQEFYKLRKEYTSTCKKLKRKYETDLLQKLETLHENDKDSLEAAKTT